MKAQAKISDIICILLLIAIAITSFTIIFPGFIEKVTIEFVRASGEFIARELSGLVTLLAATKEAEIKYNLPNVEYEIQISDRVITIYPKFKAPPAEKTFGIEYFGVEIGKHYLKNSVDGKILTNLMISKGIKYELSLK